MKPNQSLSSSKKNQIKKMFDSISRKYDLLNRIITFGNDIKWRKKMFSIAKENNPKKILDIATGTADVALELSKIEDSEITGIDISNKMLSLGRKKIETRQLSHQISLECEDAENLPYPKNSFDLVTISFGVRNFQDLENGLKESNRVLKKNGVLIILETSIPKNYLINFIYMLFIRLYIPFISSIFSNNVSAYSYLQKSAEKFPSGEKFVSVLKRCGFKKINTYPQMLGATSIYTANK
ncbi:MAG: bifunctional demethylmenaquinone methyltransferase/2-methoxy-6-polyprenyl-1,4-benzoquinol methylase UbiE [Flavobacteriaceae bacterium]|nr:bifunctional demethylmenaquinone methyltransferase/2-methoxy-6-polyprenyl-1,4-benzoquinol methylase UbiE [Flavobacteriaceae bacterium]